MTILRSGTTKKYSENWGSAFGGKPKQSKPAKAIAKKKPKSATKTSKKKAKKK